LGDGAPLSTPSIARLKAGWQAEYDLWKTRSVADLEVVYLWVDGVYVKVENATAVIWKTLLLAEKTFRRLDAPELLADVANGVVYSDGIRAVNQRDEKAAA
jgi:hypothetical protein